MAQQVKPHISAMLQASRSSRGGRMQFANRRTPDLPIVEEFEEHWLFVYGYHMQHFDHHSLFKNNGAHLAGKYVTTDSCYSMMAYTHNKDSSNQAIVLEENSVYSAHIMGELYKVPSNIIRLMDAVCQNTTAMRRTEVSIRAFRDYKRNLNAWMYVGIDSYWENLLTHFNWRFAKVGTQRIYENGGHSKPTEFYRFRPIDQWVDRWSPGHALTSNGTPRSDITLAPIGKRVSQTDGLSMAYAEKEYEPEEWEDYRNFHLM